RAVATDLTLAAFARRRVQRIGPPYLASVLVAATHWFWIGARKSGALGGVAAWRTMPALDWARNFTITQWTKITSEFARGLRFYKPPAANDALLQAPYWSLGYEEQFYAFLGLLLVIVALSGRKRRTFPGLLAVATLASIAWTWRAPGCVTG